MTSHMAVMNVARARKPQQLRPPMLNDRAWLENEYVNRHRSSTEIGQELGCTREVVRRALKRLGIPRRKGSPMLPSQLRDRDWLAQRLVDRMSTGEIAQEAGCTKAQIDWARRWHGLEATYVHPPHPATMQLRDVDWCRARVDEGLTLAEIAQAASCSPMAVCRWLAQHGLSTKPRPEVARERRRELRAQLEAAHPEVTAREHQRRAEAKEEWRQWCATESNKRATIASAEARERWQLENSERRRLHRVQTQAREKRERDKLLAALHGGLAEVHAIEIERERIRLTQLRPRLTAIAASLHSFQRREDPPAKTRELLAEARKMGLDFGVCFPVVIAVATEGVAMEGKWRESMRSMQGAWAKGWDRQQVCTL